MFLFISCFIFGSVDFNGDQEATNIFKKYFKSPIHKCSVEKDRTVGGKDYNYIGAIVQVTINE